MTEKMEGGDILMMALIRVPYDSPEGRQLFRAFPEAVDVREAPIPKDMLHRIEPFGIHNLAKALKDQKSRFLVVTYQEPVEEFAKQNKMPDGLSLEILRGRKPFSFEGGIWTRIFREEFQPYPVRPERKDFYFFCVPAHMVT